MNGCDYVLHLGQTTPVGNKEGTYAMTADIACPAGQSIQVTQFSASSHAFRVCTQSITGGTGLSGLHATGTLGSGDFDVKGTLVLTAHKSGLCGAEGNAEARLHVDMTFKGAGATGESTSVLISDEAAPEEQGELTADGPVTLTAAETGASSTNRFEFLGGSFQCPGTSYTGHEAGSTTKLLSSGSTTATITPHYAQETCHLIDSAGTTFPATVDMNGCDFLIHIGQTDPGGNEEGTYGLTADIVCSAEQGILLTAFSSDTHAFRVCTTKITGATGLSGLHARYTPGTGHVDIQGAVTVTADRTGLCGSATDPAAKLRLDLKVEGRGSLGESTSILISDQASPPEQGELTSDGPVTLTATSTGGAGSNALTSFGESYVCSSTTYRGHEMGSTTNLLPSGSTTATITPLSAACLSGGGLPVTIDMNGCDYVFHIGHTAPIGNKEGTYGLTADIVCPAGQQIQWTTFSSSTHSFRLCSQAITSATGLGGAHLKSTPLLGHLDIEGTFSLTIHKTGPCGSGTDAGAKLHIDTTVKGVNALGKSRAISVTDG